MTLYQTWCRVTKCMSIIILEGRRNKRPCYILNVTEVPKQAHQRTSARIPISRSRYEIRDTGLCDRNTNYCAVKFCFFVRETGNRRVVLWDRDSPPLPWRWTMELMGLWCPENRPITFVHRSDFCGSFHILYNLLSFINHLTIRPYVIWAMTVLLNEP